MRYASRGTLIAKLLDDDANFRHVAKCDGADREAGADSSAERPFTITCSHGEAGILEALRWLLYAFPQHEGHLHCRSGGVRTHSVMLDKRLARVTPTLGHNLLIDMVTNLQPLLPVGRERTHISQSQAAIESDPASISLE